MTYTCPVCGYDKLYRPPEDFLICPSCGTEFDYHDAKTSHAELRKKWIASGSKWHSKAQQPPENWVALNQLAKAHLITVIEKGVSTISPSTNRDAESAYQSNGVEFPEQSVSRGTIFRGTPIHTKVSLMP